MKKYLKTCLSLLIISVFFTGCSETGEVKKDEISPDIFSGIKIVDLKSLADDNMFFGNWRGPRFMKRYFRELYGKEGGIKFMTHGNGSVIIDCEIGSAKNNLIEILVNGKFAKKIYLKKNVIKKVRVPVMKGRISENGIHLKFRLNGDSSLKLFSARVILSKYAGKFESLTDKQDIMTIPSILKYHIIPKEGDRLRIRLESPVKKSSATFIIRSRTVKNISLNETAKFEFDLSEWVGNPVKIVLNLEGSKKIIKISESELVNTGIKNFSFLKNRVDPGSLKGKFNVLLIVLDSMRADRFSFSGYKRIVAPAIERLSKSSIVFNNHWSEAAYTLASTATLITGLPPDYHNVTRLFSGGLNRKAVTIAEIFKESGYFTAAVSAIPFFGSDYNLDQGFSEFVELFRKNDQVMAEEFIEPFKRILEKVKKKGEKFFVYLHIREPHIDYFMPPPFFGKYHEGKWKFDDKRFRQKLKKLYLKKGEKTADEIKLLRDCYDENLAYADSVLGKIFQILKYKKSMKNTIIIVTSDHGESLGEHGLTGHNVVLYREGIQIPLIIYIPGLTDKILPENAHYSTSDLTGFLMTLSGGDLSKNGSLFSQYQMNRSSGSIISRTISFPDLKANYVLKEGPFRCIVNFEKDRNPVIFNIMKDPKEEFPIRDIELNNYFLFKLRNFFKLKKKYSYDSIKKITNSDIRKKLKSLGYL